MRSIRLIARLDVKNGHLIKGINLEGLRKIGDPNEHARRYYEGGVDELVYIDPVATLYGRNHLGSIIAKTTEDCFIPFTVGGGIRSIQDCVSILKSGADKVAINTASVGNPGLVREVAERFGSQCMVGSIQAKRIPGKGWGAFVNNGREYTGRDAMDWAEELEDLGAGEILLTSIDNEGTRRGFDTELIRNVAARLKIPVIASGGFGALGHLEEAVAAGADALAFADSLHYGRFTITEIRNYAISRGVEVREIG